MDLGVARLRKVGINNLHCAVHPRHGVVWSDGKGIYLAPIHLEGRQVQNAASVKLGEFENVTSVHWSSVTSGDACHLCVVHQQNVTVWRVSGALPKLSFKQVRKINVRPVPQGCLWNPCNDVLCLLSRHQCSFYFRHDLNKGSYAFPALESGSIVCGCWSTDGAKLIICVGTVLLIYRWPDINASLDAFAATAWRIPGLEGKLTSIAPVLKDSIVVAAEVPLDSLCKQPDLFKIPDSQGDGQQNSDGVIRPLKSPSAMDSLMNLQHNSEAISDTRSTLTVVHLSDRSRDPVKLSTVPLKGVLTPDILIYEKNSHCIVVGSNSQSQLHIYALLEKHLAYCGNIQLDKNQRPKGLCSIPTHSSDHEAALLILVGHRGMEESGFLSSSLESEFKLSLKYIMLKTGSHHHSRHSHHNDNIKGTPSVHTKSSSLISSEPGVTGPHHLKTLSDPSVQSGRHERQMAHVASSDISTQMASPVKDSSLELETLEMKPSTDDTIHKKRLIEDLASDPSSEEQLQVDTVSFASHVPSFDNSKLAASYQLEPTDKFNIDQAPLQNSVSEFLQQRKIVGEAPVNTQTLITSSSMEERLQTEPRKHLKSSSSIKEQLQFETEKQNLSSSVENQLHTEQGKHLQSSSSLEEQLQTELGKHSNSWSETAESTDECQAVRAEGGYGNTDVTNNHMQKSLSPSINMPHNGHQISILSASTPVSSQTEEKPLLAHLHLKTKLHTTSVYSEASEESPEDLSSSDMLLPKSLSSLQTDCVHTLGDFSNSLTDSALQMSSISSQTDSVYTSEDVTSLQTDRTPQETSVSSQTEADSSDCLSSSSYYSIKAPNISAFSQTEDLLTEVKSETKSISSQTSPVYLSGVQSKILEAKDQSLQTSSDTSDHLKSSQFQVNPEASTTFLHRASVSSECLHIAPSVVQSVSDERADILDFNHTLKAHELAQVKEDTLSDFGLGSSQHSIDSSWDALEKEARSQKDSIDALHHRLELLSSSVDKTTCVFPSKYQDMSSAEILEIYCEKPEGTETKKFLLDNGRLQLEPIKLTFGLATVELWLDGIPCVAGANIDGYIPLRFSPSTRLHITGRPADK